MSGVKEKLNQYLEGLLPQPSCAKFVTGEYVEFIPGKSLTIAFPVKEEYLNPALSMQGGLISTAFDNVFGPLCLLVTNTPYTTTLDINTSFHRPIYAGDVLTVTATVTSSGKTKIHMLGEAYDGNNKLIATATTNYFILDQGRIKTGQLSEQA
ncbi:MAG: PaaI family thioesterase [Syntrophomonadaceae bacterium]|nr:PaaI family thioesterase [Syntrophomonadaceae bacterium]